MSDWEHRPRFWCRYAVGWKEWRVAFGFDGRTVAGRIYRWVDQGTGERHISGMGHSYVIVPKNAKALHFFTPTPTKTTPGIRGIGPGIVMQYNATPEEVFTKKVVHPGIQPRDFSRTLRDMLNQRNRPGGFRSVTDAAVKRAMRKLKSGRV